MSFISEAWMANRDFMETGGWVLSAIAVVTFLMWTLIIERYWYLFRVHPGRVRNTVARWQARSDKTSWEAHQIRRMLEKHVA